MDAGCGLGLLSLWAVENGASAVTAVDIGGVELAETIAQDNGVVDKIQFIEANLWDLNLPDGQDEFDLIVAMVYLNDPRRDEYQTDLAFQLRDKYLASGGTMIPDRVRYRVRACDWPAQDYVTRHNQLSEQIAELGGRYNINLGQLSEAVSGECWKDLFPAKGYDGRLSTKDYRLLSTNSEFVDVDFLGSPQKYPGTFSIQMDFAGIFNAVIWTQELWHEERLLFANESVSWLSKPEIVGPGTVCTVEVGADWRRRNLLHCILSDGAK